MSEVMMQKENDGKASHGSEFARGIITEQAMAERGSVQARLRSTKWMEVSFFFFSRLMAKTLLVENRGRMIRAKNSRGKSSVMAEVFRRRTCGEMINVVTDLRKMKKRDDHGGTNVAVTLRG